MELASHHDHKAFLNQFQLFIIADVVKKRSKRFTDARVCSEILKCILTF